MDDTSIWVKKTTKQRLKAQLRKGQSMDSLINNLLDGYFFTPIQIHDLLNNYVIDEGVKEGDWLVFTSHITMEQISQVEEVLTKYGLIGNYDYSGGTMVIRILMKRTR